ncbi:tail fiber domain-containing protein [Burkholderia ubonensis]|uniref:tail fiber domain-containing protein n=1 Tax=Burkholderia ubonensis TaxID=101571 RepID=UPI0007522ACE|nr:tail fiber domain-containing protein [Burkholderia ubonensis]KWN69146.1 hypothetical protein WM23_04570 [Burkholderia ubonensis]
MMAIVGSLPVNLTNGTTADASQVMSDLNYIANQVNANAMPLSGSSPTFQPPVTINDSSTQGALVINAASNSNGANIKLTGNGATTPNKYITASVGVLAVKNSAYSATIFQIDDSGNTTATGAVSGSNITGTSDETLKKDWKPFGPDFLEMVAEVLHGTYTRIDTGERRVGAGAQSLRKALPEAVFGDDVLSISEGSAALAIVIELTREVLRLRALLEPVK